MEIRRITAQSLTADAIPLVMGMQGMRGCWSR
jgi:hypothetical protein